MTVIAFCDYPVSGKKVQEKTFGRVVTIIKPIFMGKLVKLELGYIIVKK